MAGENPHTFFGPYSTRDVRQALVTSTRGPRDRNVNPRPFQKWSTVDVLVPGVKLHQRDWAEACRAEGPGGGARSHKRRHSAADHGLRDRDILARDRQARRNRSHPSDLSQNGYGIMIILMIVMIILLIILIIVTL